MKIKVGSDFSGVGAFNQALQRLGIDYEEVFACDMDKYARQTFIDNYGEPKYYPENVYNREIPTDPLDIYMTSPPCQAFSLAGKRKGEDDDRGILFYNSHEFIVKNKPRYFIFENVKGLLSDAKGRTFQIWLDMLGGKSVNGNPVIFPREDATPYHVYWKVLNAKDYGVPQNRERVFIIGIRDDKDNNFHFPKEQHLTKRLKDVLELEVLKKFYLSEKAINKCLKSEANKNLLIKEVSDISKCIVAGYYKIPFDGQYIKVESNLEKYFLSEKNVENLISYNNRQVENGTGFSAKFRDIEKVKTMDALKCGGGGKDDLIKIKSATKKGYEEAQEGDSINFSVPNSETRRGRVGKGVAQTLDTQCNQGIWIAEKDISTMPNLVGLYNDKRLNQTIEKNKDKLIEGEIKMLDTYNQSVHDHLPCIKARHHQNNDRRLFDGYKIRRLTPRECFRLMDFPDSFKMPCSDTQMYKQAGNSIVVGVLAELIKKLKL